MLLSDVHGYQDSTLEILIIYDSKRLLPNVHGYQDSILDDQ